MGISQELFCGILGFMKLESLSWLKRFRNQALLIFAALGFAGTVDFFEKNFVSNGANLQGKISGEECTQKEVYGRSSSIKPGLFVGCAGFLD